jgi:signal transduction histidine kinase
MKNSLDRDVLKKSSFFSGLVDEQLDWLLKSGECLSLKAGEILMTEGSLPDSFYVLLEGEVEILKRAGNRETLIAVHGVSAILGEMSLIENAPRTATVRAAKPCRLLKISQETFNHLIHGNPSAAIALLQTVMWRLKNTEGMLRQQERLASLGTLAAGLAHELNNPAAAAGRSASQLQRTIGAWLRLRSRMDALQMDPAQKDLALSRLSQDIDRAGQESLIPGPLERSDREFEIENWLVLHSIEEPWEYAPALAAFGWTVPTLSTWFASFDAAQVPVIICYLATGYLIYNLLDEINTSTGRITEIVNAVKEYTFLDQAPQKKVDVHSGLESTLVILKHKLKQGISIQREYDPSLPLIEAYGGELNQVWTNLIANAVDAMGGSGELRLRTYCENGQAVVEIGDNGPGIPADVLPRLFEPFFTTKEPGQGTGLGLYVSHSIIRKHRGKIEITSNPGDTLFKVSLPLAEKVP